MNQEQIQTLQKILSDFGKIPEHQVQFIWSMAYDVGLGDGFVKAAKRLNGPLRIAQKIVESNGIGWGEIRSSIGEMKAIQKDAKLATTEEADKV